MVIQPIMSAKAIVETWETTKQVFENFHIPISDIPLHSVIEDADLDQLIIELNKEVGSSALTCINGG